MLTSQSVDFKKTVLILLAVVIQKAKNTERHLLENRSSKGVTTLISQSTSMFCLWHAPNIDMHVVSNNNSPILIRRYKPKAIHFPKNT
ncbi:hypothetical protein CEXT_446291 [Caerostris extrusa]|uniref:Uncharacterized protein n=1 Tax=Caerostris extrusa TaxID=172846 RepID=A0AAV4UT19_CAEEX|nr:hypothetical protein CEXT_446291 [Caerostris extrusa]